MRPMTMALLTLLAGCAAPAAVPEARPGEAPDAPAEEIARVDVLEVRLGQTARLGDVSVRPIAVVEDSRCPRDVQCVWAGRLRLRAAVSGVGETELILGQALALPGGGTLTLTAAAPAPRHRPPPGTESGPATRFAFRRD